MTSCGDVTGMMVREGNYAPKALFQLFQVGEQNSDTCISHDQKVDDIDDAPILEDCHQFWTVHSRGFISHIITFFSPWHSYPVSWLSALLL